LITNSAVYYKNLGKERKGKERKGKRRGETRRVLSFTTFMFL
jgi:hypothetical protein